MEDWDVWHCSGIALEVGFEDSDVLCFLFVVDELGSHMLFQLLAICYLSMPPWITVSLLSKLQINSSINCLCGDNLRGTEN